MGGLNAMLKVERIFFSPKQKGWEGLRHSKELKAQGWISISSVVNHMHLVLLLENTGHFEIFGISSVLFDQCMYDLIREV